jgi:hypothetical protein
MDMVKQPSVISLDDPMSTTVSGHTATTTSTARRSTRKRTAQPPTEEECFEEIELRRRQALVVVNENSEERCFEEIELERRLREENVDCVAIMTVVSQESRAVSVSTETETTTTLTRCMNPILMVPPQNDVSDRQLQTDNKFCCTENTTLTRIAFEKHLDKACVVQVSINGRVRQETQLANNIPLKAELCNKTVAETEKCPPECEKYEPNQCSVVSTKVFTEVAMKTSTNTVSQLGNLKLNQETNNNSLSRNDEAPENDTTSLTQLETSSSQPIHINVGDGKESTIGSQSFKEQSLSKPLWRQSCKSPEIVACNKTTPNNLQLVKSATSSISSKETSIEEGRNHIPPESHPSSTIKNASNKQQQPTQRPRKIPLTTYEYVEEDAYEIHEIEPLDIHNISSDDDDDEHISVAESRKKLQFALAKAGRFPEGKRRSRNSVSNTNLRRSDSTDEESTLASTAASTSAGPVSYVEFQSEVVSQPKPRPLKPTTLFTPNDDRLADIPKVLAVDLFSDVELQVKTALKSFRSICNESNLPLFFKYGGPLGLIAVLRKWGGSAAIQAAALETFHKAGEMTEFANVAVELGALDLVVLAMKNHCDNADVLTAGCGALLNLTLPASVARALVLELDGIQIIAAACASFPQNLTLQKYALYNLQYMSYWDDFKEPIVAAGGLQALTEMMETFKASPSNTHAVEKSAKATMKRLLE